MTEQNKRIIELMKQTGTVDEKTLQEKLKQLYYAEGKSPISDEEYDELFGNKDYVGYTVEQNGPWEVLEHRIAMGSLNKLKTWEQAEKWIKNKGTIIWEPKLDGLSMELVYEKGLLVHAILRGGGDKGEDILKNAKNFIYVKPSIETTMDYVSVRGEVVISQENFDKLKELSNESYSNRRNCVPGICRRYDGNYSNLLSFYAYDIVEQLDDNVQKAYLSELDKIKTIYQYGFKLPFVYDKMTEEEYMAYGEIRDTAEDFQMDGLVLKVNEPTGNESECQIALKFEPKGEQTKVTDYSWEIGSTGKYVPTIWFEPVTVGGSRLTKAAIGSFQGYIDLNAPIGSVVEVRKMGDVIPKVTKVIERKEDALLQIPIKCPHCGAPLQRHGADLYCDNSECPVKQESKCCAVYWAISLKSITDSWIKELLKQGKIRKCYDVLTVKAEDIANLDGYSTNTANKIIDNFKDRARKMLSENKTIEFLWMLPIPTVSGKAYEKLDSLFHNFVELESWLKEWSIDRHRQLIELLGNAKGNKTYNYINQNIEDILILLDTIKVIGA